ncbi:unnamed protein product [Owenia fusiformis]|uniref:Uncharacterized protein n=1 Tax=Owenia fusiformis TaxID=6347 RepID=A0A8J1T440_OWEFU|nr:unnamed protein product [Owenia fusiformis]
MALSNILLFVCLVGGAFGQAWDGLHVRFGLLDSFLEQPRTVQDAEAEGYVLQTRCAESNGFYGNRYIKNNDSAVLLLFDGNGYISGIQAGVPKGLENGYPSTNIQDYFNGRGPEYVVTAYFNNPTPPCGEGRSEEQFETEGTGTGLYIQNGPSPTDVLEAPFQENDIAGTGWTEGLCFSGMGKHYWPGISQDMDCDDFKPVFLLYNNTGRLNGFGWAFNADLSSEIFEHPPPESFGLFMATVPQCLLDMPHRLSTLHIYLTAHPRFDNICD